MRKRKSEQPNHERWLVSYADFITLLFAFFVIMYATSRADLAKFKKVAEGMKRAFDGPALGATTSAVEGTGEDLSGLKEAIEQNIQIEAADAALSEKLQVLDDEKGLAVRLVAKDFFLDGEVEVPQELRPILDRLGQAIKKSKRSVVIEGHTDSKERAPPGFASEWEFSAARAGWVARYWISRLEMNPKKISIAGYSHFKSITTREDEWSRAANRRVEMIILRAPPSKKEASAE